MAVFSVMMMVTCRKNSPLVRYFEVGLSNNSTDWRDTSFIVATSNTALLAEIDGQLQMPAAQRKRIVIGSLVKGSGGYNRNTGHEFKWHLKEDDWQLTDLSIEIYDGRPHTDVDVDLNYWMNTVKRFSPWSSYIKREVHP